ncbi:unnamed protein product [Toxocara canis]|uniref:Dynamin-type G domain-containing protein n=1 Tax=Toxocara canis TaxID=6265 RepID=A0A183UK41_TOXCA|nr:unnamed protein product [Toxocara canis]
MVDVFCTERLVGQVSGLTLFSPHQRLVAQYGQNKSIRKVVVGGEQEMSIGDKFRFTVRKESAPTTEVTEYVINNSILPFSVAIVDTPGVIDEKGYKGTSTIIRQWCEQELASTGQFRLDAISLVLKSDEEELGWPYIHELAEVKRLFGDDLKTNVLPIVTHTEILPQPLAVHALAYANVTFLEYYKINNDGFIPINCARTVTNKTEQNRLFIHGKTSFERYFTVKSMLAILLSHALVSYQFAIYVVWLSQ